jgi:hypothetical protein
VGRIIASCSILIGIITTSLLVGTFAVTLAPTPMQAKLLSWLENSEHRRMEEDVAARVVTRFLKLYRNTIHRHHFLHGNHAGPFLKRRVGGSISGNGSGSGSGSGGGGGVDLRELPSASTAAPDSASATGSVRSIAPTNRAGNEQYSLVFQGRVGGRWVVYMRLLYPCA